MTTNSNVMIDLYTASFIHCEIQEDKINIPLIVVPKYKNVHLWLRKIKMSVV